jgi:excisionase family DNA binding protein
MRYTDFDQLPVVLSVEDLTEILGIGRNTAYDLVRSGKIKSIRVGNQIRISKSALREFLDQ